MVHAAKLLQAGAQVGLLKTSTKGNDVFFDVMSSQGGFNVKDDTSDGHRFFARPEFLTRDVKKAVEWADVIMVMTTTSQHEEVARLIAPFVRDGQTIALIPGYMGSLLFKRHIYKNILYSEWETTAYNGRIVDSEYVRISFYNPRNAISTLPAKDVERAIELFSPYFPNTIYRRRNILESALHNPNMIVHPIGTVLSSSRIELSGGEFYMYREAFTPSVVRVIKEFDKAKNEVLNAFGCESLDYFEAAKWRNEEDLTQDSMDVFRSFGESSNKGPTSINHRYLTEDVPNGLGWFISLAELTGTDYSVASAIMRLSSALLGKDFKTISRTIQNLTGKEDVTASELLSIIE